MAFSTHTPARHGKSLVLLIALLLACLIIWLCSYSYLERDFNGIIVVCVNLGSALGLWGILLLALPLHYYRRRDFWTGLKVFAIGLVISTVVSYQYLPQLGPADARFRDQIEARKNWQHIALNMEIYAVIHSDGWCLPDDLSFFLDSDADTRLSKGVFRVSYLSKDSPEGTQLVNVENASTDIYRLGDYIFAYRGLDDALAKSAKEDQQFALPPEMLVAWTRPVIGVNTELTWQQVYIEGRQAERIVLHGTGAAGVVSENEFLSMIRATNSQRAQLGLQPIDWGIYTGDGSEESGDEGVE